MASEEDREDKMRIMGMLYGHHASAEVTFRHLASDVVHRVQATSQAIGVTYCGIKILRSNSSEWATTDCEMPTCMGCIGSEPFEPVDP